MRLYLTTEAHQKLGVISLHCREQLACSWTCDVPSLPYCDFALTTSVHHSPVPLFSENNLNLLYCVLSCLPFRSSWRSKINGTPGETLEELHRGWTVMGQAHNLGLCFFPASRSSYFLRSASNTCWHQVSESLGLNVPISQGHKFLRSQGLSVWYS